MFIACRRGPRASPSPDDTQIPAYRRADKIEDKPPFRSRIADTFLA
jgi:hypothetical protein